MYLRKKAQKIELKTRVYYFTNNSQKYCVVDAQYESKCNGPQFTLERQGKF